MSTTEDGVLRFSNKQKKIVVHDVSNIKPLHPFSSSTIAIQKLSWILTLKRIIKMAEIAVFLQWF
jgi:hypothetical protein